MKQRLLITMLTLLTSITMQAFTPKYGDTWDEATKTLTVNSNPGPDAYSHSNEIMKVVFSNNVTTISTFAFWHCDNLTSITISNSVTTIGSAAFANCGITSVYIPEGVKTIDTNPFGSCIKLTNIEVSSGNTEYKSIDGVLFTIDGEKLISYPGGNSRTSYTIPEGVRSAIGAFGWDPYLKTLNIPSSFNDIIDNYYFSVYLASINVAEGNKNYKSIDGVLFSKDGKELIFYPKASTRSSYTIPDGVVTLPEEAFRCSEKLTSVILPSSVTSIPNSAFSLCTKLTSITIPNSVTSIGEQAFRDCTSLVSITIPDNVTSIGDACFMGCSSLKSINIPKGVTRIEHGLFAECTSLTSFSIGQNITSIGDHAFAECSNLASITIPQSVTSIGEYVFDGCNNLTSVEFHTKTIESSWFLPHYGWLPIKTIIIGDEVKTLGEGAFESLLEVTSIYISNLAAWCNFVFDAPESNPLYHNAKLYLNGKEIVDLVIPDSVTSIGNYAFHRCKSIKTVTMPQSVTSIGHGAFAGCDLASITIPQSVTSIGKYAFEMCWYLSAVNISDLSAWCNINFQTEYSNPMGYNNYAYLYLNGEKYYYLVIPNDVTSIGKYAFCNYRGVRMTIPHQVTAICDSAFYRSDAFSLNIGSGVTTIGKKAFGSTWLRNVYCYADKIPSIANDAFDDFYEDSVTLHVPAAYINNYKTAEPYKNFKNIVALTLQPYNVGQNVNFAKAVNKYTCLDGFMVDRIFYSINNNDGAYDTEKECIMLNKPTADATVKDLLNKDLFTKEFRNGYTGIVMKLAPGSGYLNVEAETIGDISLKVKIGNDAPKEMISDGKQTAPFQYNVNDETYVYIYASENTSQARNLRSGSADSSVMLYNIEISDTPNDISSITTSAENTHIFDLQGNRLEKPHKGVNVIRMKDGKTKKVVVK